jgi:acyl homoserine lactone synthase
MLYLIKPDNYSFHRQDLDEMYKLRYRVFCKELKWEVKTHNGMEKDEFDQLNSYYVIYKDQDSIIKGCLRLIEMTKECMFDGPFRFLLPDTLASFKKPGYWEVSRLAIDTMYNEEEFKEIFTYLIASLSYFSLKSKTPKTYLALSYPTFVELAKSLGISIQIIEEDRIDNKPVSVSIYVPDFTSHEKLTQRLPSPVELEIPIGL